LRMPRALPTRVILGGFSEGPMARRPVPIDQRSRTLGESISF
jgi:hypothetical protein